MGSGVPSDAYDLLPAGAVEHWATSGERFGDHVADQLPAVVPWFDELRDRGMSEIEIACAFARIVRLEHEEWLGLVELIDTPDGGAIVVELDPFAELPTVSA
jgi:hypothetical protein